MTRERRRRWLRIAGWSLAGALLAVLGLVTAVLWIPAVSQLVVRQALIRWDASNPAEIAWDEVSGSLARGLAIDGLAVHDGEGQPLVLSERLALRLDLAALLDPNGPEARVTGLVLTGVEVHVDHRWQDLGNPDAEPSPPSPGYGPDLPLKIVAAAEIDGLRVMQGDAELVAARWLGLSASGEGRTAALELGLARATVPTAALAVRRVDLRVVWDEPRASVERLDADLGWASLGLSEPVALDLDARELAFGLALATDGPAVVERFELGLGLARVPVPKRVGVDLRAEARLGDASGEPGSDPNSDAALTLAVELGEIGHVQVGATLAYAVDTGAATLDVDLDAELAGQTLDPRQGALRLDLVGHAAREADAPAIAATLGLDLHEDGSGEALRLDAEARLGDPGAAWAEQHGSVQVRARGLGLALDANVGRAAPGEPAEGALTLDVPALARPLGLVGEWLGQPALAELAGSLAVSGTCVEAPTLRCSPRVELDHFAGFGVTLAHAQLDASVEPLADDQPRFDARLQARGLAAASGQLALTELDARVRGTPTDLNLEADAVGPRDRAHVAVGLHERGDAHRIDLAELELTTTRGGSPTTVALLEPGSVTLGEGSARIDALGLAVAGGQVHADGTVAWTPEGRQDARVRVEGLDLARVDPLIGSPGLAGHLDLDAAVSGRLDDLRGHLRVDGRGLAVGELAIGDLALTAARGGGQSVVVEGAPGRGPEDLRVAMRLSGPLCRRLELTAAVPVRGLGLGPGPLDARLQVDAFALESLAAVMPATPAWWDPTGPSAAPQGSPRWIPEGRVDLDLGVSGTARDPRAALLVRATHLRIDRVDLGSLRVLGQLDADAGVAELSLTAQPGSVGVAGVELRARVPVDVDLRQGRVRWLRERELLASAELIGVDLEQLREGLGPSVPGLAAGLAAADLDGKVSASLRLAGTVAQPQIDARVRGLGLRQAGQVLGELQVDLGYAGERAELGLELAGPLADRLDAHADVPLVLDLGGRGPVAVVADDQAIRGEVRVEGLGLASLAPWAPLGFGGEAGLELGVSGTLAAPEAHARVLVGGLASERGEVGDLDLRLALTPEPAASQTVGGTGPTPITAGVELDLVRAGRHLLTLAADAPLTLSVGDVAAGELVVAWDQAGHHRLLVSGRGLDRELLAAFVELPPDVHAELGFDLNGGGSLAEFQLGGGLAGELGRGDQRFGVDARIELDQAHQRLALAVDAPHTLDPASAPATPTPSASPVGPALTADVELGLPIPALVAGTHELGQTPFGFAVTAPSFDLAQLATLLPRDLDDPEGRLVAELHGAGVLARPELSGSLAIRDAAISVIPLRQRMSDIGVALTLDRERIVLEQVEVHAGKGSITGSGSAQVQGTAVDADVDVAIAKLPVVRPGMPALTLDAGIGIEVHAAPDDLAIAVEVREPELLVASTTESAPKATPSSTAVRFVDAHAAARAGEGEAEGSGAVVAADEQGRLRLRLTLVDPFQITGGSVDMAWGGTVTLERVKGSLVADGRLDSQHGRLDLLGSQFDIARGSVILPDDGTLDPFLDLVAVTKAGDYEVTATITGRVSRPELHFSANPGLDEYEIFSLLVTGSPTISDAEQGTLEAKAAGLLAAVSSPALQAKINQTLHIDRASLGFGDTVDQPILTVGKRVGPKVYVETSYHHNAPENQNTGEIRVHYRFATRWLLETYFGDAAVGGVGTYWSRSFAPVRWKVTPSPRTRRRRREAEPHE